VNDDDDDYEEYYQEARRGLVVRQWTSTSAMHSEAVIFLHGFNSPMSDALKRVAQLWTLGDFPPHLKPFVFGWPAARELTYFQAKGFIEGDGCGPIVDDFVNFIRSLIASGVRQVHVLAHSMGARLIFSSLEKLEPYLVLAEKKRGSVKNPGMKKVASHTNASECVRLSTCTLMNPDASLQQFLDKDFTALRRVCSHITLYGDNTDGALFWSETFNRERALGKHPFALVRTQTAAVDQSSPSATPQASNGATNTGASLIQRASLHVKFNSSKAAASTKNPPPFGASRGATSAVSIPGSEREHIRVTPLDLDVIDTSWMDANVHAMRHNIFNVNRWVVDDLREIIYTQKRARFRNQRLIHRSGNVWSFLAAPKHIVNP